MKGQTCQYNLRIQIMESCLRRVAKHNSGNDILPYAEMLALKIFLCNKLARPLRRSKCRWEDNIRM